MMTGLKVLNDAEVCKNGFFNCSGLLFFEFVVNFGFTICGIFKIEFVLGMRPPSDLCVFALKLFVDGILSDIVENWREKTFFILLCLGAKG